MLEIALTGCRYSGKSSVSKLFRKIGVPVFDSDTILKFILNLFQNLFYRFYFYVIRLFVLCNFAT